jgi:hypothetical protein
MSYKFVIALFNSTVDRDGKPNMTHHPELLAALVEDSLETQVQEQQASTAQNRNTIYHLSAKRRHS